MEKWTFSVLRAPWGGPFWFQNISSNQPNMDQLNSCDQFEFKIQNKVAADQNKPIQFLPVGPQALSKKNFMKIINIIF